VSCIGADSVDSADSTISVTHDDDDDDDDDVVNYVAIANIRTDEWVGPLLVGSRRDFPFSLINEVQQVQHWLCTIHI